jgi:signal transduction histidine kinase
MKLLWYLQTRHRWLLAVIAGVLLLITTYADWATGPELTLTVFYVVPVALATLAGLRLGIAASGLAALGWSAADALTNAPHSHPLVPYWNALAQLALYLAVTFIVEALQRSRLMQQELMAFIVHDLRSPLTAIGAALKTCSPGRLEPDDRFGTVLHAGLNSLDRMSAMVSNLLDVARAEGAGLKVSLQPVDPSGLVANAAEQMRAWAGEVGVGLQVEIEPDLPPVSADPELSLRVLANLLSNAIKYSPRGSVVTISTSRYNQATVVFAVTDHGPGVPKQWVDRVFGKFVQVEARKSGAAVGTGLGLAFCEMATAAQGGRIWMVSEPDVETVVSLTLPVVHQARARV